MKSNRWISMLAACAVLALPALTLADHNEAGGQAEEHRSERAAERSNAQWDEGNEGAPDKPRGQDAAAGDASAAGDDAKRADPEGDDKAAKSAKAEKDAKAPKAEKNKQPKD